MKYFYRFLLLPLLLLALCACRAPAQTVDILNAMCDSQTTLPAGRIYRMDASPGDAAYADEELLSVLYGNGSLPPEFEVINDFSIRLCGFTAPHELAVFRCVSQRDAYDVAQMCLRRAERLQINCRETEHASLADGARVCIIGKYVLMATCNDPIAATEAGRRAAR